MKTICNTELRKKIIDNGLRMYEVANALGVTPCYLSHLLGHELRDYEEERITTAIEKAVIAKKRNSTHGRNNR